MKTHKYHKFIIVFTSCLLSSSIMFAQKSSGYDKQIDATFESVDKPNVPGVAAGIIKDGEVIYLKGFGSSNLGTGAKMTTQTKFQLGEMSKQFTTVAILLLEQQGKISLQDDIRKYMTELPQYNRTVTVDHLLNHTSGLYDVARIDIMVNGHGNVLTQSNALGLIASQQTLSFEPGTDFSFHEAITESVLMAEIVARVSEQTFATFVKTNIFEPLGMSNSLIRDDSDAIIENVATPYQLEDENYKSAPVMSNVVGAINAYSTAEDLTKWYLNYAKPNGTLGRLIQKLDTNVKLADGTKFNYYWGDMAIGREFTHPERGLPIFWNFGLQGGYGTNIFRYLDQNIISFALGSNSEYNGSLAMNAIEPFVKDLYTLPSSIDIEKLNIKKLSAKKLKAFEGYYWFKAAGYSAKIYVENDTLRNQWLFTEHSRPLLPLSNNTFQMVGSNEDVRLFKFMKEDGQTKLHFTYNDAKADVMETYVPIDPSQQKLEDYTGTYYNEAFGSLFSFKLKEGQLIASNLDHGNIEFLQTKKDVFTSTSLFFTGMEFHRNSSNQVDGFTVDTDGIHNFVFTKIDEK